MIRNIGQLATPLGAVSRRGGAMDLLHRVPKAAIAIEDGVIVAAGPQKDVLAAFDAEVELDAEGRLATPALCDPHTHAVFAGSRALEYDLRLRGTPYQEIARQGGGILSSVREVRSASPEKLERETEGRLRRMLAHGTTVVEVKSGYGLDLESELKSLNVIQALGKRLPMELVSTFLGAHEFPPEFRENREAYVDLIVNEMIPTVAQGKLAEFCDVFCEAGVFTPVQSRRILEAGKKAGLHPRIHAEEFECTGGAALAGELGCASADHLLAADDAGIRALAAGNVTAVLLPGTSINLGIRRFAEARKMIEAGIAVALGTDCNPGSGYVESMPLVMSLACGLLKMTAAEALTAATLNAAYSLRRGDRFGSLETGKQADFVLWDAQDYREIPYRCGTNLAWRVFHEGREAAREGRAVDMTDKSMTNAASKPRPAPAVVGAAPSAKAGKTAADLSAIAYVDGASRNNPGLAGAGVYLTDEKGNLLAEIAEFLGVVTNNQAEYQALLLALEKAAELGVRRLQIRSDSQLMVRQMQGQYKIKDPGLQKKAAQAREMIQRFDQVSFEHVYREQNRDADRLANLAIDQHRR